MKDHKKAKEWFLRAQSNFALAKLGNGNDFILYEDLCFDLQQAAEKSLKAVCILNGIIFPKTHDIAYLISLLEKGGIAVPEEINDSKILTDYAVETRYPAEFEPITEVEYLKALELTKNVMEWVKVLLNQL
ncbi:MAG: HEPN domain-containing protein [Ignavibacteriales bacterium]|nr:HEPN domain-containing protein [Ignavibacteriales bacterium]